MSDKLSTYRAKRSAQKTPEPMGEAPVDDGGRRFVIQEHHATRLHWDLRLEHDGVLVSFAIPNGLPEAPKDNRLAVHTEDHPLEYLEFEGDIPKGQYGAGSMRIWDRGSYEELKWEPRKIEVRLHGERLQARYALFPIDKDEAPKNWMIHRMDPPADDAAAAPLPDKIVPMMARPATLPRDDGNWAFEVKWDGVRAICHSEPGRMRLHSRNLLDITPRYPEIGRLNRALSHHRAVLDGEVVALDADGRPSFGALQRRMHVSSETAVRRLAKEVPVTYVIFDLLWLDGHSLMDLPYSERRARLAELELGGGGNGRWQVPDYVVGHGEQLLAATERAGPRGRDRQAPGLDLPAGAAHAVVAEGQAHRAPGGRDRRMGAGRRQASRPDRRAARRACATTTARCATSGAWAPASPRPSSIAWPSCCARSSATTRRSRRAARRSRAGPSSPSPSSWPRSSSASGPTAGSSARPPTRACATTSPPSSWCARRPTRSSPTSPGARSSSPTSTRSSIREAGFAKRDVIDYFARIAPAVLPHVKGRALTLKRYPNGVDKQFFYEKNAPSHRPDWVATARVGSIDYVVAEDEPTLVWLANLADLELHTSLALAAEPERPTLVAFDLDPGPPATVVECCRVAELLRGMFDGLGLQCFAKTSGSKGMQVYLPLNSEATFAQTKAFAKTVAELLAREEPGLVVARQTKSAASGQGARRLEPERRQQDDRHRLLAARDGPPDGLDAGHVGRGPRDRGCRGPDLRRGRRPATRRGARRPLRPGGDACPAPAGGVAFRAWPS